MSFKDDNIRILDVFGGADGGVDFAKFKCGMEDFERRAIDGDDGAIQLVEIVSKFRRLIDAITQ